MRIFLNVMGVLFILTGGVWFFQGLNILKSSVMSGDGKWIIIGGILFIFGIALLVFNNRKKKT